MEGCAPAAGRHCALPVARALSGRRTLIVLASLYGTPWGPGASAPPATPCSRARATNKIQTFFLNHARRARSSAGSTILPGIGAHEFDFIGTARRPPSLHRGRRAGHARGAAVRHALSGRLAERHAVPHQGRRPRLTPAPTPRAALCPRPWSGTKSKLPDRLPAQQMLFTLQRLR